MFDFTDKVVVVTGASGISMGITIAKSFYEAGAKIAICSRNEEKIRISAEEIAPGDRERMLWGVADTTSVCQLRAFTEKVIEKYGKIDVWVNNAGISFPKPSLEVSEEDWDRTVDTNLKGYFFGAQCAVREMVRAGLPGCVVNTILHFLTLFYLLGHPGKLHRPRKRSHADEQSPLRGYPRASGDV